MSAAERSPRQTLSYLRELLEARGLRPKSKLGQSFLIDLNLVDFIVRNAELTRGDLAIEVGTGSGGLTAKLAEQAGHVLGVELDAGFYELARSSTAAFVNVTLVHADVLKNKNHINPDVLAAAESLREQPGIQRLKLVANLPYVVATPVISNFLLTDLPFERMVVTIQWELAERLVARPSTKDYSALSVLVQSLADVTILRRLPPSAFWPRPKVDSAIILVRPNAEKRREAGDVHQLRDFLRDLYLHRRKNLRGTLFPMVRDRFSKESLDTHLRAHGFDPTSRAEALTVGEHLKLREIIGRR